MFFFYLLLIVLVLVTLFILLSFKDSDYWKKRGIVYVKKTTPVGILFDFVRSGKSLAEVYKDVYDKYPNEANVGFFIGRKIGLLLRDPENIQAVMTRDFQSFHSRGLPTNKEDLLADNVLFIDDFKRWKLIRQKVSPVFTSTRLKSMFYIIERSGRDFVAFVKTKYDTESPFSLLYTYTTASIGASVFGIDTKTSNTMDSPFLDMAWKTVTPSLRTVGNFLLANAAPPLFKLFKIKIFGPFEKFFIGVVKSVLQDRQNQTEKIHDFIDLCLELQKNGTMRDPASGYELEPTDEILAAQAFFFFIAGADTSANTMNFTLIELSYNLDILDKVHREIDEVFDEYDDKITYEALEKMTYLDMVINETLRKYPPIGLIQRRCTKDTILPVGNVTVEKDNLILLPVYALHRDERFYPNPNNFEPERFSDENIKKIIKFAYLPFGEGNRICIGARYARIQVKLGLAWLLRKFTLKNLSPPPESYEPSFFSVRSTNTHYSIVPRDGTVSK